MMNFWRGVFSDGESPSSSRVIMALFAVAAVVWVSIIVRRSGQLPGLWDLALFVCSPYLVNKGSATVADFRNPKQG
jgi:hypothetical protein